MYIVYDPIARCAVWWTEDMAELNWWAHIAPSMCIWIVPGTITD